jgi:hypothetical protein
MSETETDPNPFAAVTWPESYTGAPESADNGKPAVTTLADATPAENGVYVATGIEAAVCADIAKRQRRGIAKYGKTVWENPLQFVQWLEHFYEELLDAAVYAKRIIHEHENQKQNQDDAGASGVLHRNPALHPSIPDAVPIRDLGGAGNDPTACPGPAARPRKPGGGRKPLVCPSCGGVKTIGSSMKDGVPIKRCKACGHVHKSYPHLANGKAAAKLEGN